MARKSTALLKSTPIKLAPHDKVFIAEMRERGTPEGTEDEFEAFLKAVQTHAEAQGRMEAIDKLVKRESEDELWQTFTAAVKDAERTMTLEFRAFDFWQGKIKHLNDPVPTDDSEVRATIIDSLSDKLDELEFSLNVGLLGSKVAQAIRDDVSEGFEGDPPLCQDCDG